MAREVCERCRIPHLDLDDIAWAVDIEDVGKRLPLQDSQAALDDFLQKHNQWVIEGCYGDLIERAVPLCTELRFLNPDIETCVANSHTRQREREMVRSQAEYEKLINDLIAWVRQYETRDDEFSLARHRAIFDSFTGQKREFTEFPEGRASQKQ